MRRVPVPNLIYLPFVERAWIPEGKLTRYVLSPEHPKGRHKARLFEQRLGIVRADWKYLRDQILGQLPDRRVSALGPKSWIESGTRRFGIEFEVRLLIDGLNGERHEVVTGWMVSSSCVPTLSTARVSS